jgi:glycosyltransferase involved in cell wall biosynthesis
MTKHGNIVYMNALDLTVIIPHHNRPTLLLRLLHTIPPHVNAIVVDDASEEFDLIESFVLSFDNVTLIPLSESKGAGVARQVALKEVTTSFVMFADSDDVFLSNAFEVIAKFLNPQWDVIVFKPTSSDLDGQLAHRHESHHTIFDKVNANEISSFDALFKFKEVWSKVYKTEVVKEFQFSKTFVGNDLLFSAQVAVNCHERVLWVNKCVYAISDHEDAISYEHTKERYKHRLQANDDYFEYCFKNLPKEKFYQLIEGNGVLILWPLIKFGDLSLTWQAYKLYRRYRIKISLVHLTKRLLKTHSQ